MVNINELYDDYTEIIPEPMDIINCINHCKSNYSKYINYFEAIIDPNGNVIFARPSHQIAMLGIIARNENTNISDIYNFCLDNWLDPINYFVDKENYISVWFDRMICSDNITDKQKKTIYLLKSNDLISKNIIMDISNEYRNYMFRKRLVK